MQAHIPPLSNYKNTGEEYSSLHNSKHTKHTHGTRVQNTTLYSDGTTHCSKGVQPNRRTISVALDLRKAFDTINIHTLIRKLLQTNIPDTIMKFIENYIKIRKVYRTYKNHTSIQRQFKTGVPLTHTIQHLYYRLTTTPSIGLGHGLRR